MLPLLALVALVGIAGTLAAPFVADAPLPARVHLTFAIGIAPLILAALGYFVPVLTRSAPAPGSVLAAPFAALAAGILAVAYFAAPEAWPLAYPAAAVIELAAVGVVLAWMVGRARTSIGTPHPCIRWYVAATACLAVALAAILAMPYAPEHYIALKRLHLHLNLLGFVGLTAVGTLQVLVPTAAGGADPRAAARLDSDLKWALAGTLLIAAGAAWFPLVAAVGLFLWLTAIRPGATGSCSSERLLALHGAAPARRRFAGFRLCSCSALCTAPALDPRNAVLAFISPPVAARHRRADPPAADLAAPARRRRGTSRSALRSAATLAHARAFSSRAERSPASALRQARWSRRSASCSSSSRACAQSLPCATRRDEARGPAPRDRSAPPARGS
jgi:hypothetical protein